MDDNKVSLMREGGHKLAKILKNLVEISKVGITTLEIELQAQKMILESGGEIAFAKVPGYKWATCINVNDGIVHGIPNNRMLNDGDLLSIDIGLWYKGYYTDTSTTIIVGEKKANLVRFLDAGKKALEEAIKQAKIDNHVGDISLAIESELRKNNLVAVKELTGHGVGKELHEKPFIPGFVSGPIMSSPLLHEGQTLAIEVIYTNGNGKIILEDDGWTISTKDGKISGLFEETVVITRDGPEILTSI